ncbi:MAG: hypothetical protein ACOX8V_05260 [Thermoleophilia bacterium]|jgi:phosphohistidine phosphatase SixA
MSYQGDNREVPAGEPPTARLGHLDAADEAAIIDYLDGSATTADAAAVERHMAASPSYAARLQEQVAVQSFLLDHGLTDPPQELEDQILGELFFPSQVIPHPQAPEPWWTSLWQRRLRPWMPATAAVATVIIAVVVAGVLLSPGREQEPAAPRVANTADGQMSTPVAGDIESATALSTATGSAAVTTTAIGGVATTAAAWTKIGTGTRATVLSGGSPASASGGPISTAAAPEDIRGRKAMVKTMTSSSTPVYIVFSAKPSTSDDESPGTSPVSATKERAATSGASSAETSARAAALAEEVRAQVTIFTEMEPLPNSLAAEDAAFACYVPHKQASGFIDLLLAIAASVGLDLTMQEETASHDSVKTAHIVGHKAELPVLVGYVIPQPATARIGFTTTTIITADASDASGAPTRALPDEAGTHVLTIIVIRP